MLLNKVSYQSSSDRILSTLALLGTAFSAIILVFVLVFLFYELTRLPFPADATDFFKVTPWNPTEGKFGVLPMVAASLVITLLAVLLALPIALLNASFLRFHANPTLKSLSRRCSELLAGIPSVVFGFWGLVTLVPWVGQFHPPGANVLSAGIILAMMILPTMALIIDNAFHSVPKHQIHNARSLGLGDWGVLSLAILPNAKRSIWMSIFLSVARAIGETMAVLMVCGNIVRFPTSLFVPVRTLTANIALELGYAEGPHRASLFVCGIILMVAVGLCILATQRLEDSKN